MNKVLFFFFLTTVLFSAQNQRFSYEYKYIQDSTEMSKVETEMMNLDIAPKGSKFYSNNHKIADSIMTEMNKNPNGNRDYSHIKFGKVAEVIEKMYPNFDVFLFQRLDVDTYKVQDGREIIWNILPEKEKIGDWETQKATTKMYGRTWTAWFSTSISFQDGPYKFHGLPGLIVKISDQSNTHVFELKEIKNLSADQEWKSYGEKNLFQKSIPLKQEKFKKNYLKYREDPVAGMRQMMSQSDTKVVLLGKDGKATDMKYMLRSQEKNMKESFKKNNNLLELDLLK